MTTRKKEILDLLCKVEPIINSNHAWEDYTKLGFAPKDVEIITSIATAKSKELHSIKDNDIFWNCVIGALRYLAQSNTQCAVPKILERLQELDNYSDFVVTEFMPSILAYFQEDIIPELKKYIGNRNIKNFWCQIACADALALIAKNNENNPKTVALCLDTLLSFIKKPNKKSLPLNSSLVYSVLSIHKIKKLSDKEFSHIQNLYKNNLADISDLGDIEDVEIEFGRREKRDTPKPNYMTGAPPPPKLYLNENYHERIGRNDPCLCGSGKKFKKCCLN